MSSKSAKNDKVAQRRALIEQQRKAQKAKERRRAVAGSGVVLLVLAGLIVAVVVGTRGGHKAAGGAEVMPAAVTGGQTVVQTMPAIVPNTTGIEGVVAYDTKGYPAPGTPDAGTLSHDHVTGPVQYAVIPPVGGQHNGVWMNAGVYDKPVPTERAVHNLEHGAVWITYRPNLPASQIQQLRDLVGKQSMINEGDNSNRYVDLSPWADNSLSSPIVISSWGYQLKVDSPTDPRLQQFIDKFRHNKTYTPEYGASVDSIPVDTGGRPLMYGAKYANPSGSVNGQGM